MKYFLLVILLLLPSMLYAQESYDFRNVKWGMTREEVKAAEKEKPVKEDDRGMGYMANIDGHDVLLIYVFVDDKLVRSKYVLMEEFSNKNDYYFKFFNPTKDLLREKYGKPKEDSKNWLNNLYRKDPQELGMAISVGHYAEFVTWEPQDTKVIEFIMGNKFKINTGIEYISKKYEALENKAQKKKALGNL